MALRYGVWSVGVLTPTSSLREALVAVWEARQAGGQADPVHHAGDGRWHTVTGDVVAVSDAVPVQVPAGGRHARRRPAAGVQDVLFELVAS